MTAPTKPVAVDLTPKPSPVQKAINDARASLTKPESAGGEAEAEKPEGEEAKPEGEEQKKPEGEEGAKPEGEEGEKPKEGEEAKPEEEEGEKPKVEGEGEGEVADELVVEIPGRRPGDKPLSIALEDKETADLVRQRLRDGMRKEDFHRKMKVVDERNEDLELLEKSIELDPVGFIADRVKPEYRIELAKHLMSIPEVYAAVAEETAEWADDNVRARRTAELAKERGDRQQDVDRDLAHFKAAKEQARVVRNTVEAIVSEDFDEETGFMFREDCLSDVAAYARSHREVSRLRPEEVVGILERRLRHYGLTPESALAALSSGQPPRRAAAPGQPKKAAATGTPDADAARNAGAKLKQAGEARRAAAAVPGAGAGARPTTAQPPAQQGVKERIKWAREKLLGK